MTSKRSKLPPAIVAERAAPMSNFEMAYAFLGQFLQPPTKPAPLQSNGLPRRWACRATRSTTISKHRAKYCHEVEQTQ